MFRPTTMRIGTESDSVATIAVFPLPEFSIATAWVAVAAQPDGTFVAAAMLCKVPPCAPVPESGGIVDVAFFAHDAVNTPIATKQTGRNSFFT